LVAFLRRTERRLAAARGAIIPGRANQIGPDTRAPRAGLRRHRTRPRRARSPKPRTARLTRHMRRRLSLGSRSHGIVKIVHRLVPALLEPLLNSESGHTRTRV